MIAPAALSSISHCISLRLNTYLDIEERRKTYRDYGTNGSAYTFRQEVVSDFYTYVKENRQYSDRFHRQLIPRSWPPLWSKSFSRRLWMIYPKYVLSLWELMENCKYSELMEELWRLQFPYYIWISEMAKEGVNGEGAILKSMVAMAFASWSRKTAE